MPRIPVHFTFDTSDWKKTRHPGISIRFLRNDRRTGDTTALIRMDAGCGYPEHRHVGEEEVFVLAGAYRDHSGTYRAGEYVVNRPGSVHEPAATAEGVCILLAVAHGGIQLIESPTEDRSPPAEPQFEILVSRWADNPRVLEWHRWWQRRTEELRARYPWLHHRRKLAHVGGKEVLTFLDEEARGRGIRWPLGLFGTQRRKVAHTPGLAEKLDALLWADEPLEARVDGALAGPNAFIGAGRTVAFASLLLQTAFPEKIVGPLSLRHAQLAFPVQMPPGATPGERFAMLSRTMAAAWKNQRPDQPLNVAFWVLWMEYAAHHVVRPAIFRA